MTCNHEKLCHDCIREEIKKTEEKLAELKKKLPAVQTVYIQGGCSGAHYCPGNQCGLNHWHGVNCFQTNLNQQQYNVSDSSLFNMTLGQSGTISM